VKNADGQCIKLERLEPHELHKTYGVKTALISNSDREFEHFKAITEAWRTMCMSIVSPILMYDRHSELM
jgi:hypothetical protein